MNRTLIQAAGKCDLPLLEQTLVGEYGQVSQEDLNDALARAASLGYSECVSRLLAAFADCNAEDADGNPIITLAAEGGHIRVVRQLLTAGCDVNAMKDNGRTALHMAARESMSPIALQLLRSGLNCDPNCQDDNDDTPVMFACLAGNALVLQLLLHQQADVNLTNNEGKTALHCAAQSGNPLCVLLLEEAGADMSAVNVWRDTPLLIACKQGEDQVGSILVSLGADVHSEDRAQRTPLHYAIKNGMVETTQALLEAGAMDITDADSTTPLMEAVLAGQPQLIASLIGANFNVNALGRITTASGERIWCSPLEAALRRGDLCTADILLMAGGSLQFARDWDGAAGPAPQEIAESETARAWLQNALQKPLPLMALARLSARNELGFWPQKKIKKLKVPAKIRKFLSYEKM